jgi:hypothetical protein
MKLVDDFLDQRLFRAFLAAVTAESFPWELSQVNSQPAEGLAPELNRQAVHGFFMRKSGLQFVSPYFDLVRPILFQLRPREVLKVKLNRTGRQESHLEYGMHVDTRRPGATTAVLYLNTNNGYTLFADGRRVESVANRLVMFDASLRHTGVSCTDAPGRLILNINVLAGDSP